MSGQNIVTQAQLREILDGLNAAERGFLEIKRRLAAGAVAEDGTTIEDIDQHLRHIAVMRSMFYTVH